MLGVLGIKNPIDKQKLAVKAQDLVLFGPPKGEDVHKFSLIADCVSSTCWCA